MLEVDELIIDSFAGAGGASEGIKWATGREPDIAVNHDEHAIQMHELNHPGTLHIHDDVWRVDMLEILAGRRVGLLWASPDCTNFSRAKGDVPVDNKSRGLAGVITKWAKEFSPRIIFLENVREFELWGPLCPRWTCRNCRWKGTEGQTILARVRRRCPRCNSLKVSKGEGMYPDPEKKGMSFRRWVSRLRNLGYAVEWRVLSGADYGAPTSRKRLFLVARRDGLPIQWPEPTHAPPKKLKPGLQPYRTAAECINWDLPCPSIFERDPPLVEATMRRIAMGLKRYVLEAERPFIVRCNHGGDHFRGQSVDKPFCTITSSHDAHGLVQPMLTPFGIDIERSADAFRGRGVDQPLSTITVQPKGGKHAVVAPLITKFRQGSDGQAIDQPMPTITANSYIQRPGGAAPIGLVSAFMAKHFGGVVGVGVDAPLPTTTAKGCQNQLVAAHLTRHYGRSVGQSLEEPCPTTTAIPHTYLTAATMIQRGYGEREGQAPRVLDVEQPLGTVVAGGIKHGIAAANLIHFNHGDKQWSSVEEPLRTIVSNSHARLVYAFLTKWYGTAVGQSLEDPMHTIRANDCFGLVVVHVAGVPYIIVDIGMRMLEPEELMLAQGFPSTYVLTGAKYKRVARIGNSVVPQVAAAVVRANLCQSVNSKPEERQLTHAERTASTNH